MGNEDLFFDLLQVAIGTRNMLDRQPTSQEWALLFDMSKNQALSAIAFAGLNRLKGDFFSKGDFGSSMGLDEMTYSTWLGVSAKVVQRNKEVSAACVELVKQFAHDGIQCCILNGQGNLEYYPEELKECRTSGNIDVWCAYQDPLGLDIAVSDIDGKGAHYEKYHGKHAVIEYVKMLHRIAGTEPMEGVCYHHIDAPSENGVDVDVLFSPVFLHSPLRNHRLQEWFRLNEQFGLHDAKIGDAVFPVPTVSFNAVYQLCHIYRHLFDEGIVLRELLDYYFILRVLHIEQGSLSERTSSMSQWAEGMGIAVRSKEEILHTLSSFGMRKFAGAVMYVLQTVFAMPDVYLLCSPNEREGMFLLNEIMQTGNFGKHNLRLLTHYPEEVFWEPFSRVYHWAWRKF